MSVKCSLQVRRGENTKTHFEHVDPLCPLHAYISVSVNFFIITVTINPGTQKCNHSKHRTLSYRCNVLKRKKRIPVDGALKRQERVLFSLVDIKMKCVYNYCVQSCAFLCVKSTANPYQSIPIYLSIGIDNRYQSITTRIFVIDRSSIININQLIDIDLYRLISIVIDSIDWIPRVQFLLACNRHYSCYY